MELGETDEVEFGSFQTDLWELDYNGHDAPGRPLDVVPPPSEAVDQPPGSFVDLPSGTVPHDEFQSSKFNFSNLLTQFFKLAHTCNA